MNTIQHLIFFKGLNIIAILLTLFGVWPGEGLAWINALCIAACNNYLIMIGYYK